MLHWDLRNDMLDVKKKIEINKTSATRLNME